MTKCPTCKFFVTCKDQKDPCQTYTGADSMIQFHTKPFEHQRRALDFLLVNPKGAVFMEMGTGKTKVILDYIINSNPKRVLIVCPLSVISVWHDEILKHAPSLVGKVGILEVRSDIGTFPIEITNYEKVRIHIRKLFNAEYDTIVLDESIRIKNIKAMVTKRLCWLGKYTPTKIIMSGAPIVNSEIDLWSQFLFLDDGQTLGRSLQNFKTKYFDADPWGFVWKPRPDTHERIAKLIEPRSFRCTKSDCLDLPPKVFEIRKVSLSIEQATLYKSMKDAFLATYYENNQAHEVQTQWILAQLTYLQEIACGYVRNTITQLTHQIDHEKIQVLSETLDELADKKVVIWTRFNQSVSEIEDMLRVMKREYFTLSSDLTNRQRRDVLYNFKTTRKPACFISNASIGGYGIDLTCASYAIYYSNSFNYSDRIQSEDRLHRQGQTSHVTYIDLVTQGTIEEDILQVLQKKQNILEGIIDAIKR